MHLNGLNSPAHPMRIIIKKSREILLLWILVIGYVSCNQQNAANVDSKNRITIKSTPIKVVNSKTDSIESKTYIRGKVHHWITDTVYLTTLPFYSPYSNKTYFQTLSKDSSFQFDFNNIDKPIIVQLAPTKAAIDGNINILLFDNLTDKHYFGQCEKFNTYELTTYLLEPGDSIIVELQFNSWIENLSEKKANYLKSLGVQVSDDNTVRDYGKTGITFLNSNARSLEYYQEWFAVDDKFDREIERSKNVDNAYNKVKRLKEKLLSKLQQEKTSITPFLYGHLRAYIEFGARKELLKYLTLEDKDYLKGRINNEILDFFEFDKNEIDYPILSCDQYNDYLEFYLTYKMNNKTGSNLEYYAFNKDKFVFAMKELPEESRYHYLANQLLHQENLDFKDLTDILISKYHKGDLNAKLVQNYSR